jgi:presenilin-like A22 family membrane protease
MRSVLKGNPHAGLPALNGGALIGFLIPVLWLFGTAPLIPQF